MTTKLNAAVSLARMVKSRVYDAVTALHRESQKEGLYAGLQRTYRRKNDEGDRLPPEGTLHQLDAEDVLRELRRLLAEAWDAEGTLVRSSNDAYADVEVNGRVLVAHAPTTYLLYLEKQLADVYTFIGKLPVLDPSETWRWDEARGCWITEPAETTLTKKIKRSLTLHEGNEHHPPQVLAYDDDDVVGFWSTVKLSGALPVDRKRELLLRVTWLRDAVKIARERANLADVVEFRPAGALLAYVLDASDDAT